VGPRARRIGAVVIVSVCALGASARTSTAATHKPIVVDMTNPAAAPPRRVDVDDAADVQLSIKKGMLQQCSVETKVDAIKPEANPIGTIIGIAAKLAAGVAVKNLPAEPEACSGIGPVMPPAGDRDAAEIEIGLSGVQQRLIAIREELTGQEHDGPFSVDALGDEIGKLTRCVGTSDDAGSDRDVCRDAEAFSGARDRVVRKIQLVLERRPLAGSDGLSAVLVDLKKLLVARVPKTIDSAWYWNAVRRIDCYASQIDNLGDRRKVLAAARVQLGAFAAAAMAFKPSTAPFNLDIPVRRVSSSVLTATVTCVNVFTRQPTLPGPRGAGEIAIDPVPVVITFQSPPRLAASAGLLLSTIDKLQYGTQPAKTGVDATGTDTAVTRIVVTDTTSAQTVPFSFLHLRLVGWRPGYGYLTGGIGLNPNNGSTQVEYFAGLSLGIKNVMLSAGAHYGRVQELAGGFHIGDIVGDKAVAPVSLRYVARLGVSVSYKIPTR
jgi:hypothetical protein